MSTLIPNGGRTTDTSPEIRVGLNAPLRQNCTIHVFRDNVDLGAAIQINPTLYGLTDFNTPGTYAYTARVFFGGQQYDPSPAYTISIDVGVVAVPPNHGWAALANVDGGYAVGNSGVEGNSNAVYADSFWIGVVGDVSMSDVVSWDVQWTPLPTDIQSPPITTVVPPGAGSPWRLHITNVEGPVMAYRSGKLRFALRINGALTGVQDLQLVLSDTFGYGPEIATWGPYVADAPLQ